MPGLEEREESLWLDTSASDYGLMSDGVASELVKKFFFTSRKSGKDSEDDEYNEKLEVYIPEVKKIVCFFFIC